MQWSSKSLRVSMRCIIYIMYAYMHECKEKVKIREYEIFFVLF